MDCCGGSTVILERACWIIGEAALVDIRLLAVISLGIVAGAAQAAPPDDPYVWLEDAASPAALTWVADHNARTDAALTSDRRYEPVRVDVLAQLRAQSALPAVQLMGGFVYNLWQSADH